MSDVAFPFDPNIALSAQNMTEEQRQGFDLALRGQITWARQIEQAGQTACNDHETVTRQFMIIHQAKLARGMAEAMRLAVLGR